MGDTPLTVMTTNRATEVQTRTVFSTIGKHNIKTPSEMAMVWPQKRLKYLILLIWLSLLSKLMWLMWLI